MVSGELVIIPGHAVLGTEGGVVPDSPFDAKFWKLMDFQEGELPYYREHMLAGIVELVHNPKSLLVFSGGRTCPNSTWSEAASYAAASRKCGWWISESTAISNKVEKRIALEEFATDSLENFLFSICRYYLQTGEWPTEIKIFGWGFKAERFDMHREALHIKKEAFQYIGINDPENLEEVLVGEEVTRKLWRRDVYGVGPELEEKSRIRNPFGDKPAYDQIPSMAEFFAHLSDNGGYYLGKLPWEQ